MESSWLRNERTERSYKLISNEDIVWTVVNEYQIVKCLHCDEKFFCRLTHIYESEKQNFIIKEYHTNYKKTIEELKELRVGGDSTYSIYEKISGESYVLYKDDEIIAEELTK
jgi:hypothetical protein